MLLQNSYICLPAICILLDMSQILSKTDIEKEKLKILNKTELDEVDHAFDVNALRVLAARYLLRDSNNEIVESPKQMFERIAVLVAISDILHDERVFDISGAYVDYDQVGLDKDWIEPLDRSLTIGNYRLNIYHEEALWRLYKELKGSMKVSRNSLYHMIAKGEFDEYEMRIKEYYDLMISKDFLPNTPTLMNAGAKLGQLSACFVLPIEDDLHEIMKTATDAAMIFKSGGGIGINYSKLRPEGSIVASTSGVASGPLSFMKIIDAVTEVVKQGGKRRGANMAILNWDHPDIERFITAKTTPGEYENFNISVGTNEGFWEKGNENMLDMIARCAWQSAEPGVIFFDNINKFNPLLDKKGEITCTNPCGEQALYPYESCNLGSINLANFVKDGEFDWERFVDVIRICVQFLDNVIDVNKYPIKEIEEETKKTRRIGLGIMGLADVMFKLGIQYNSETGYEFMEDLGRILHINTRVESYELSRTRGKYPLSKNEEHPQRNSFLTTIAPTGTLSMIAGVSNGVEPCFALSFEKRVTVGSFFYVNQIFEQRLKDAGIYSEELIKKVVNNYGSCKGIAEIPGDIQKTFVTAMDIHYTDHIMAQSVWQKHIDNAIAKTINMPNDSTVEDVKQAYLMAHELGCKGMTVYRDGSRHQQVLHIHSDTKEKKFKVEPSTYVKSMRCNNCGSQLTTQEGCKYCPACGNSMCSN